MKDLLIVTADSMNIIDVFRDTMESCPGLTFDLLDNQSIKRSFQYKSFGERSYNFFLMSLTGHNIKHDFYNSEMERAIEELDCCYEQILIIRPDLLSNQHLQLLRNHTQCFIAYYWDTIEIVPRKRNIVHYFDRVLSFDPADCDRYGFEFQPNFYYYEDQPKETRYRVYNLSRMDDRKPIIEEVAVALENMGMSFLLKGFKERGFKGGYIRKTHRITYKEMIEEASYCDIVLDVTKPGQTGLTLRPFEAMGLDKKLITTNGCIREYEFYNPENVLIVDPKNLKFKSEFFERPFSPIAESVKIKYQIKQWLANVLEKQSLIAA